MPLIRAAARPMLAAMFVTGGLDAFLHPKEKAPAAVKVGPRFAAGCRSRCRRTRSSSYASTVASSSWPALRWRPAGCPGCPR